MTISTKKMKPVEMVRLLNSTELGTVLSTGKIYRHFSEAGYRIASAEDSRALNFYRYAAWLVDKRNRPQETSQQTPAPASVPATHDIDFAVLSSDERFQVTAERELLALMATAPDALRPHGERMATFTWADPRNETIAWAMLATPEGTSPADVVQAASAVVPEAPRILAGGRIALLESMDIDHKVAFLLDVVELASCKREVQQIRGRLRTLSSAPVGDDSKELFRRATTLQKRIGELTEQLPSVV